MTSGFRFGAGQNKPGPSGGGKPPPADTVRISCRATNPLSIHDDVGKVFVDPVQAKATTATRLFRNADLFLALRKYVFPGYHSGRGTFDIWSSGCSSGEEVYSLAMVALDLFARAKRQPTLRLFGTDINRDRLAEACAGVYGRPTREAFGPEYWTLLNRYAHVEGADVQMNDEVRALAKFGVFDMRNRPKKHTFNYIVCNHVLQYYDLPGQLHILGNLITVLKPGGYLYLEGITDQARNEARLRRVDTMANLYLPPEP